MSAGHEHRECLEALGAYALGALREDEADRLRLHLERCHECRTELTWLRGAADALPASVPTIEPPRELKSKLMAIVESEAELLRAAGAGADRPPPATPRPRWRGLSRVGAPGVAGLAGAVAAGVLALILVLVLTGGSGTRLVRAQILTPLSGRAQAWLRLNGTRAELEVNGLPIPPADRVDELWVQRGGASPRPAGTFVLQSGSVSVLLPVRRGDLVLVTVEPGRGTPAPTTAPLIRARA